MTSSDLNTGTRLYWHGVFYRIEHRAPGRRGEDLLNLRRVRHPDDDHAVDELEVPVALVLMLGRAGEMAFVRSAPRGPSTAPVGTGPRTPSGGSTGHRGPAHAGAAVPA